MKILITGAAGFVGRNLTENLKTIRDGKNRTRPNLHIDEIYEYDIYDLVLNVDDESDIKIVKQEIKNGKTVLNDVKDDYLLKTLSAMFKEKIEAKQNDIN